MKTFMHEFPGEADDFSPFSIARSSKFALEMDFDEEGGFWLSANREGFEYMAKLFAELAMRDLWAGYHFHCNGSFEQVEMHPDGSVKSVAGEPGDEGRTGRMFTFELVNPNYRTESYGERR